MTQFAQLRKRLEAASFPDLETMMEGYARGAVELAKAQFRRDLDFTSASVDTLDEILVLVGETPEADIEFEVRLWGSYLGELLRRRYAGSWEMTTYPGAMPQNGSPAAQTNAVPAVEVRGSRVFPMVKVYRRLTMGEEEDLRSFFNMVTGRLGEPAKVN